MCLGLKIPKQLGVWFFWDPLFPVLQAMCCSCLHFKVQSIKELNKASRSDDSDVIGMLFKLKAIEAKCLQDTAGYRKCASQQIPTQVLLHNKKK